MENAIDLGHQNETIAREGGLQHDAPFVHDFGVVVCAWCFVTNTAVQYILSMLARDSFSGTLIGM